jgi:adenylate kinase
MHIFLRTTQKSIKKLKPSLQKDLDNLQEWSDKWLLKFHPNKCKVMTVSNMRGNNREQKYHLYDSDGKEVELSKTEVAVPTHCYCPVNHGYTDML